MEKRVRKADPLGVAHLNRFRQLGGDVYPSRVAEVYGRDLAAAAADTDEQVAAKVGVWEIIHWIDPIDWVAVGESTRRNDARLRRLRPVNAEPAVHTQHRQDA